MAGAKRQVMYLMIAVELRVLVNAKGRHVVAPVSVAKAFRSFFLLAVCRTSCD